MALSLQMESGTAKPGKTSSIMENMRELNEGLSRLDKISNELVCKLQEYIMPEEPLSLEEIRSPIPANSALGRSLSDACCRLNGICYLLQCVVLHNDLP